MKSTLMTNEEFKDLLKSLKRNPKLQFMEDLIAGTIIGKDGNERFLRAIQKDGTSWIVLTDDTTTIKWKGF